MDSNITLKVGSTYTTANGWKVRIVDVGNTSTIFSSSLSVGLLTTAIGQEVTQLYNSDGTSTNKHNRAFDIVLEVEVEVEAEAVPSRYPNEIVTGDGVVCIANSMYPESTFSGMAGEVKAKDWPFLLVDFAGRTVGIDLRTTTVKKVSPEYLAASNIAFGDDSDDA